MSSASFGFGCIFINLRLVITNDAFDEAEEPRCQVSLPLPYVVFAKGAGF